VNELSPTTPATSVRVLWLKVWGLAAVQGAISLTWVIYNLYLLELLTRYGFSATLASTLLIIENILAAIMEPLMGMLSDRFQHWLGSRFPFIAVGIIAASAGFIAIPMVLAFGGPTGAVRWLLPVSLVFWAFTMTLFRSPALSLLSRYAFATNLPQAASILTLVGGVIGSMAPFAGDLILRVGPLFAFSLGSITLLIAATVLGMVGPDQGLAASPSAQQHRDTVIQAIAKLGLIFGTGIGASFGFRFVMQTLPASLPADSTGIGRSAVIGAIFVALAVTALPAGRLATSLGIGKGIAAGFGALALCCGLLIIAQGQGIGLLVLAIALGAAMSLASTTTIPFALAMVSPQRAGLGTGMFFSGGAVAGSIFGSLKPTLLEWPNGANAILGAVAYGMAALFVILSKRYLDA